jgi:hypothetical protein
MRITLKGVTRGRRAAIWTIGNDDGSVTRRRAEFQQLADEVVVQFARLSSFRSAKERSFAERKATL